MKKVFFAAATVAAFGLASCSSDECCDCSSIADQPGVDLEGETEVCEDDVDGSGVSWGDAKSMYNTLGCDCD